MDATPPPPQLAIIVPYRPQAAQGRHEHLVAFLRHMWGEFLPAVESRVPWFRASACVVHVIEQSRDGRKFNRGALLNAGAAIAFAGGARVLCLHDVDLLPTSDGRLDAWYARRPEDACAHPAAAWGRYPYNSYVGGVLLVSREDFRACNGFPNDFWGWGGEDDALGRRLRAARVVSARRPIDRPALSGAPAYVDLEDNRDAARASTPVRDGGDAALRNMRRREGLAADKDTWRLNGLAGVQFHVIARRAVPPEAELASDDRARVRIHIVALVAPDA